MSSASPDRKTSNVPRDIEDGIMMPTAVADDLQLLCHVRKTPIVLYGMFLELARQCYAEEEQRPIDVSATWNPDPAKTKIWIDTELEWDPDAIEFRPALYVKLSAINYESTTGKPDPLIGMDLEQGEYEFSRIGKGTVSFAHVAITKGEAAVLSGATLDYLDALVMPIKETFCFEYLNLAQVTPITVDKEAREMYLSTVSMNFQFQDTWTLKRESPKLKNIVFRAGQELVG